jgi:hypothetical protein
MHACMLHDARRCMEFVRLRLIKSYTHIDIVNHLPCDNMATESPLPYSTGCQLCACISFSMHLLCILAMYCTLLKANILDMHVVKMSSHVVSCSMHKQVFEHMVAVHIHKCMVKCIIYKSLTLNPNVWLQVTVGASDRYISLVDGRYAYSIDNPWYACSVHVMYR